MLNLWERSAPSIDYRGETFLRGEDQTIFLMAAGGSWCNYGPNYVKQIGKPINLSLPFLKGTEGTSEPGWVPPLCGVGF